MKFICKIRCMFVVGLMLIMTITKMDINVFASEKTWQEEYLGVIDNNSLHDDSSAYLLYYIDDDEIPELYMWDNGHQVYALYTCYEGEPILCNTWRDRESIWFYSDRNGYFWSTYTTNAAYQYNIFYKLENGSCNDIYSFCIDRSEMPVEKYLINDENVGKEEYERKMAELESEYQLSSEFQINGTLNQTYDEIKQYLLDSMESENNSKTDEPTTIEPAETANISSTEEISNNKKHTSSPKTGDSKPVFSELVVIGFVSASTIVLLRKRYKIKYAK